MLLRTKGAANALVKGQLDMAKTRRKVEWITLSLLAGCYAVWAAGVFVLPAVWLPLAILTVMVTTALHSSLQHEIIHGHPFGNQTLNAALVYPALSLCIPYLRFRDTHLAHHYDARLTDPFDDPESNFMDGGDWDRAPRWLRTLLNLNNTLAGRLIVGPVIGHVFWLRGDWAAIRRGDRTVMMGWMWHLPAMAMVLGAVLWSPMPLWAYLLAAYGSLSLLKIRTYLEHQAHEKSRARTVIIEDRGPLALLFLNNNLHVVHHMHPRLPWYRLPGVYRTNPQRYLGVNGGYRYRSYLEVFRRYLFAAKDPVPHPLWRR